MKETITREWLDGCIKDALAGFADWEELPDTIRVSRDYDIRFNDEASYEHEDQDCIVVELIELTRDDRYPEWTCESCIIELDELRDPDNAEDDYKAFLDNVMKEINN